MRKFYLMMAMALACGATSVMSAAITYQGDPLTTASGEEHDYIMSGYSMFHDADYGNFMGKTLDGFRGSIALDEANGKAYIKNPVTNVVNGNYIVGELDGDKITVTLPQPIGYAEGGGPKDYVYATMMTQSGDTYVPIDEQTYTYERGEDGVWRMKLPAETAVLGVCNNEGSFYWYAERDSEYRLMEDELVAGPGADVEIENWTMTYMGDAYPVGICFKDGEVYIRGVSEDFPYSWIKGKVDGDRISMDMFQYVGTTISPANYFAWVGVAKPTVDMQGLTTYEFLEDNQLVYDAEKKEIKCDNGNTLVVNMSKNLPRPLAYYDDFSIFPAVVDGDLTPKEPVIEYYYPKIGSYGESWIEVVLPRVSVDGILLDTKNLSYRVYLDDELLVFDPQTYSKLSETFQGSLEEIPWEYDEVYWDFQIMQGAKHRVRLFVGGIDHIEVESIYRADNKEYVSERGYYKANGVENVVADKEVESTVYYDLAGKRVASPAAGIYVEVTEYTDGTRNVRKVVRK